MRLMLQMQVKRRLKLYLC